MKENACIYAVVKPIKSKCISFLGSQTMFFWLRVAHLKMIDFSACK